jgi:hypothetical protein
MSNLEDIAHEIINLCHQSEFDQKREGSLANYVKSIGKRLGVPTNEWVDLVRGIDDKLAELGYPKNEH